MNPFKYELHEDVTITASGEAGTVIGRADYNFAERSHLVRYRAADGRAVEQWWSESALTSTRLLG